jgi:23S rRNA pseudouridine1911/1915/1917 synthase
VRVLERFARHTLIEARPETGRTHQIRAHLSAAGFPLVGDTLYGHSDSTRLLPRTALHARAINFEHPVTREPLHLEAPYPDDLARLLDHLRAELQH